jgi:hypothetical protein
MRQCLICSDMPDSQKQSGRTSFRLTEVAACLRTEPRTLRRWCEIGLVPGARRSRRGRGKHWRIRAASVSAAAAAVLRATRGHARPRKKTISGRPIPQVHLRRVAQMKDRQQLRRDDSMIQWSIAASRGESFAPGEWSFDLLMSADKTQRLATAFAVLIIESGTGADHARIIGARFGWSRATFYRKYGSLLASARAIAAEFLAENDKTLGAEWNEELNAPETVAVVAPAEHLLSQDEARKYSGTISRSHAKTAATPADNGSGRQRKSSLRTVAAENAQDERIDEWLATLSPDELASAAKILPEARRLVEKRRAKATSA